MPPTTPVWISLGSNLGDRRAILDAAVQALGQTEGVTVAQVSTYRETLPVGGPPGQGLFLNAAARLDTTLSPRALLAETQRIEAELGRVRVVRWGERTLDIDLLIFGSKFVDEPDLKLPHPRLAVRRFVLEPLAEIASDVVDPVTQRTATDLLDNLDRTPRIVMLDEVLADSVPELCEALRTTLPGHLVRLVDYDDFILDVPEGAPEVVGRVLRRLATIAASEPRTWDRSLWTIVDFAMDFKRMREPLPSRPLVSRAYVNSNDEPAASRLLRQWSILRKEQLLAIIPDPTLILLPHVGGDWNPRSRWNRTPHYRLEATDPEAIVAEVVAVCRGIAGA